MVECSEEAGAEHAMVMSPAGNLRGNYYWCWNVDHILKLSRQAYYYPLKKATKP